ncbi:hypothetical protein [Burkholderia ubonensis]|uniref:hypothetical protein n=1 Tax=Burkholderia ubonensis TaxID=101571 RepID=UPI0012F95867|nr:hypothetical protein [Burkholderia ubonensis]
MTTARGTRVISANVLRTFLLSLCALLIIRPACAADTVDPQNKADALTALIGRANAADVTDSVVLARWAHAPADSGDVWVVAALLPVPHDDNRRELWTGVLRRTGHDFHLLARSSHEKLDDFGFPPWHLSLQLDLIPYRISMQETAFGVRILDDYNSTAHSDNYEAINLYRFSGSALTPIFSALTSSSIYDKVGAEDCAQKLAGTAKAPTGDQEAGCDSENTSNEEYVLGFSPNMTLGHYDLLIRTRATQAKTGKTVKRAVWDGTSYKPRSFQGQ